MCPLARNSWGQLVGTSVDTLVGAHRRHLMSMSVGTPVGTLVGAFVRASLAVVVGDGGQHSQGACAQAWHLSIKEYQADAPDAQPAAATCLLTARIANAASCPLLFHASWTLCPSFFTSAQLWHMWPMQL